MNSFYSTLYGRFATLQIGQNFSVRLRHPTNNTLPTLKIGNKISECIVGIPRMHFSQNSISYSYFAFPENEFGEVAAIKVCLASASLLSAKSVFSWVYRDYIKKWLVSKQDPVRSQYVINMILDVLARKRIKELEGVQSYNRLIRTADLLSAILLSKSKELSIMTQVALASSMLKVPINSPRQIAQTVDAFQSTLSTLSSPSAIVETLKSRISIDGNNDSLQMSAQELQWNQIVKIADSLYTIISKVHGRWHDVYLPYSHVLPSANLGVKPTSIFERRAISQEDYAMIRKSAGIKESDENDEEWLQICYEMMAEEKRNEKMEGNLEEATKSLNFANAALPQRDFVSYQNLYAELLPNIRRMIDRVRQVKNALDDNPNQESGTLDLQLVIQSMAQQTVRSDVFARDENLSKDECWTILIDSSLSLSGSSRQIKAIAICLAESANQTLGHGNPWSMFSFSDELYCIKDYTEPYDNSVKARIGGLTQSGLSYIPDALRAACKLTKKYSKDKTFIILVSDGVPSGYPGIERDFRNAIMEVSRNSINLAAIGVGSSTITKAIRSAKVVDEPVDLVKGFMELYSDLAS
jgi:hypothetical protein